MKCGIVTVYNSENCGSFLQAYALSTGLQQLNHEAVFLRQNFSDHSASRRNYLKALIKAGLRGNFAGIGRLRVRRKAFQQAVSLLPIVKNEQGLDYCVLGSDVIWDVTVPFFRNRHSFFWGTQFQNVKVISYAPSIGFATSDDLKQQPFVEAALNNLTAISVRDKASMQCLLPYCDKDFSLVCDPTYLIDRTSYDSIAKPTDLENILFIYYYGKMPDNYKEAIQKLAKAEGLKTVTFGNSNPWCDVSLAYDPLLFLSIYDKADYIITNTFHGTVFSTIYEKRFAVTKTGKQKVLNVLDMCAMSDKMTQTADELSAVLHSTYDYETTRQNIQKARENGLRYLREALKGSEKNEF